MDAVIAASKSVVTSDHLRKVLEVILAFGNYMNSSKRGGAFGFKLQSLDIVSYIRYSAVYSGRLVKEFVKKQCTIYFRP